MNNYYLLVFRTNIGEVTSIKIPHAKESPTVEELKAAMDRIITTGIVDVIAGKLSTRERVELISTTSSEYEL